MYVSLPTLDLRKIQDDIRLSPIGLQSIVFNYARLPLSCFYGNPYLQLLTEAQNRCLFVLFFAPTKIFFSPPPLVSPKNQNKPLLAPYGSKFFIFHLPPPAAFFFLRKSVSPASHRSKNPLPCLPKTPPMRFCAF